MATLDDILTAIKNGVVAINAIDADISSYVDGSIGNTTSSLITSQTLVVNGSGILVAVSVVVAGTTVGTANDSLSTTGATAATAFLAIPNTIGVTQVGFRFTNGLVITPGTGQSIVVSYSSI